MLEAAELERRKAICRECEDFQERDGVVFFCGRECHRSDGAYCEPWAQQRWSSRLLGQESPCERWSGDLLQWMASIPRAQREPAGIPKIVCTLNVGQDVVLPNARNSIREAARRWGANYLEIVTPTGHRHHYEEKLHLDEHLPDGYRVLYYDADVVIRNDCPSPFEVVPEGHWAWPRSYHPSHAGTLPAVAGGIPGYAGLCGVEVDTELDYPNTGMMLFDLPAHRPVFAQAREFVQRNGFQTWWVIADQGNLACAVAKVKPPVFHIPPMFEMHGQCLWAGWTAEMKTLGYHFCGPINRSIGIPRTCWDDTGADRYTGSVMRWSRGKPHVLMTDEVTYFIRKLAGVWRGVIVEVGSFLGGSAWYGAQIARDNWCQYHCVDTWRGASDLAVGDEHYRAFQENLRDAGLSEVQVHRISSTEAAGRFSDESVDLVFIDADHTYEGCLADIRAWWPKVKPGGWMLGHDFLAKYGVPQAVRAAFESPDEVSWGEYPIWAVGKTVSRTRR